MAKYSCEFKKKVVQAYLNEIGGFLTIAKQYNIPTDTQVIRWANANKEFGNDGLMRSGKTMITIFNLSSLW